MKPKCSFTTDHGVGVGLRPVHYHLFQNSRPSNIQWVEVITENFLAWKSEPNEVQKKLNSFQNLIQMRANVPVALHGVSLNLGSIDPLCKKYLKNWKSLIDSVDPIIVSDHLCWTGVHGQNNHDLLPLPYTSETLNWVSNKIETAQNYIKRRILIENVSSYAEFPQSEMSECEFLFQVAEKSGCGILLDINNIYVSHYNHQTDPKKYIKTIPPKFVGQIHLAGHSNMGTYLIDTHDQDICKEVWDLYEYALTHFGLVSTMIERDGNIPEWSIFEKEIYKIHEIRRKKIEPSRLANKLSKMHPKQKRNTTNITNPSI